MTISPCQTLLLLWLSVPWLVWGEGFPCPKEVDSLKIIAFGDSRAPHHPNKIKLLEVMKAEKPNFFLHLGDMVANSSPEEWQRFDRQEGKFPKQGVPLLPVVGHHDVLGHSLFADPWQAIYRRFPAMGGSPWYQYRCGALNLLVLSSQDSFAADTPQRRWLEDKLAAEEEGGFLVVALHRPPLTARPDASLPQWETQLHPLFDWANNQRGVDLVLSGHVHNYERFVQGRMALVVTGGGGAPFEALERRSDDRYRGRDPGLHYVRLQVDQKKLTLEMVAAKENFAREGAMERLDRLKMSLRQP